MAEFISCTILWNRWENIPFLLRAAGLLIFLFSGFLWHIDRHIVWISVVLANTKSVYSLLVSAAGDVKAGTLVLPARLDKRQRFLHGISYATRKHRKETPRRIGVISL